MKPVNEGTPLYAWLQSNLGAAIRSGQFSAGAALPSEKELEVTYGVSRITVRRALAELEREGLVVRGRGRQARVMEPMISAVRAKIEDDLAGMLELVRGASACVLTFRWRLPDPVLGKRLNVGKDEPVLQVDRLRSSNGRPMLHTRAHVPAWIGARLEREALTERTMLEFLAASGVTIAAVEQEMHAAPCPEAVAPLIGLSPGDPAFVIERLVSDDRGRPVQHVEAIFRWDCFSYRISSTRSSKGRVVELAGAGHGGVTRA